MVREVSIVWVGRILNDFEQCVSVCERTSVEFSEGILQVCVDIVGCRIQLQVALSDINFLLLGQRSVCSRSSSRQGSG